MVVKALSGKLGKASDGSYSLNNSVGFGRNRNKLDTILDSGGSSQSRLQRLCSLLVSEFDVECCLICARKGDVFVAKASSAVDLREVPDCKLQCASDMIADLEGSGQPISLKEVIYEDPEIKSIVRRLKMSEVFPFIKDHSVHGLLFVGCDGNIKAEDRESILAMCKAVASKGILASDVVEPVERHIPQVSEPDESTADLARSSRKYFDITSRLLKIYNAEVLFETFVDSARSLLGSNFCVLYMPKEDSSALDAAYMSGDIPGNLGDRSLDGTSALFDLLRRRPGAYLIEDLEELIGSNIDLEMLRQEGIRVVAPVSIPDEKSGLVGLGMKSLSGDEYSFEDREIAYTLGQTVSMVLENIYQFKRIEELSYIDSMTRLYNYRYFYKRLNEEILRAKRFERYLALSIFDIDDFKVFNDSYGHQTGDYILRQLGSLLLDSVRAVDIVCRYGGEEFCVIMPESDRDSCAQFMERLRLKVAGHAFKSRFSDRTHTILLSAGGAIFPDNARRSDRLIYCADMALLEAKKAGRNRCRMFADLKLKPRES